MKIYDLAENLIKLSGFEPGRDIEIKVTGLRPGEKLYEELLMNEEGLSKTGHEKIFIGRPGDIDYKKLKVMLNNLLYVGNNNELHCIQSEIKKIVPTYKGKESMKFMT